MADLVYLDYNATTPVADEVLQDMLPWFSEQFWNSSSAHPGGRTASRAVESAREQVASLIGSSPREIVWTSGSTEANNLALKGRPRWPRPVTASSSRPRSTRPCSMPMLLKRRGIKVEELPVRRDGVLDMDYARRPWQTM